MTHQHNSDHAEQEPALAVSEDTSHNEATEQQRSPYDEFNDRLEWARLKWRYRKAKWFTTPMEVAALLLGVMTLFAVIAAAVFAFGQLRIMQQQLTEAQKANRLTHRPWLAPQIDIAEPLTFFDTYAQVTLRITIRNGGTAPAIRVEPILGLNIGWKNDNTNPKLGSLSHGDAVLCSPSAVKSQLERISMTTGPILPNSEITLGNYGTQTNPPYEGLSPEGTVAASVSGCIAYLDDAGEPHATYIAMTLAGWFKPTGKVERPWILLPSVPAAY